MIHRDFRPEQAAAIDLPRYDADLFIDQVMLLADVYVPAALGRDLHRPRANRAGAGMARDWSPTRCEIGTSLMHRDYHVDNLMRLPGRPGPAACGLLDFQNAGLGPISYDLVSLLEDARRDVPTRWPPR